MGLFKSKKEETEERYSLLRHLLCWEGRYGMCAVCDKIVYPLKYENGEYKELPHTHLCEDGADYILCNECTEKFMSLKNLTALEKEIKNRKELEKRIESIENILNEKMH